MRSFSVNILNELVLVDDKTWGMFVEGELHWLQTESKFGSLPPFYTKVLYIRSLLQLATPCSVSAFQVSRLWHSANGCCGNPSGSLLFKTHKTLCVEQKYTIPARVSQKKDGSLHVNASSELKLNFHGQ